MSEHVSASAGKVVLSPLAMLALTIVLPIAGSMVKDRIGMAGDGGTVQTEIANLKTQVTDMHAAISGLSDKKVGKDEFELLTHDLDARLQQIQNSLDDMKRDQRFSRVAIAPRQ